MEDWQTQFDAMRRQFLPRAAQRLTKTVELLGRLETQPANQELLSEVYKDVHWLAGAGGTYKLRQLTEIGNEAEEICDRYLGESIEPQALTELKELLLGARKLVEKELE